jgi:serine/threonine-protein kinase
VILAPGVRVGPYVIVSAIGQGGVGEVYLADDPRLRRQVALKILNEKYAGDETARGRFPREAQSTPRIRRSPPLPYRSSIATAGRRTDSSARTSCTA